MKIGLISDIHGNLHALKAVLAALDRRNVDMILCAGDLVGYGAHPIGIIGLVRSTGIPCVAGDCDTLVAANGRRTAATPRPDLADPVRDLTLEWTRRNLTERHRSYLRHLPHALEYRFGAVRMQVFHAGVDEVDAWFTPEDPEEMAHLAACVASDVVVLGHTHRPFTHVHESHSGSKTLFINPGAVGVGTDGDPRASYAVFDTRTRRVEFGKVDYALAMAIYSIEESGMPTESADLLLYGGPDFTAAIPARARALTAA